MQLHELGQDRDQVGLGDLCPRPVSVVAPRDDLDLLAAAIDILVSQPERLSDPQSCQPPQRDQETVAKVRTGVEDRKNLLLGQRLWQLAFLAQSDRPGGRPWTPLLLQLALVVTMGESVADKLLGQ